MLVTTPLMMSMTVSVFAALLPAQRVMQAATRQSPSRHDGVEYIYLVAARIAHGGSREAKVDDRLLLLSFLPHLLHIAQRRLLRRLGLFSLRSLPLAERPLDGGNGRLGFRIAEEREDHAVRTAVLRMVLSDLLPGE